MTHGLIVASYALAAAVFAVALNRFAGIDAVIAALAGLLEFVLCAQVHASILRARDRTRTEEELAALKSANLGIARELDEARRKMDAMSALEQKSSEQGRKIVAELQVLESLIREFAENIARKAASEPAADETLLERRADRAARSYVDSLGEPELLELIRRSLEENRVDLYLQPIVSLPQRKLRFYEALSRLRAENGSVIMPQQYIKVAAPAGLMSVVDNLLLFRCVQVVRRLTQKRRDIGVFCNISGDTLKDAEFFPQFLDFLHHNRDLARQIVFEFAQDAILDAGESELANLRYLAGLGFALSMDQVRTLDLDFARLKELGFVHLKVRADTLVSGMGDAHAVVAAEDFRKLLARHGLDLIAERIEEERTVVQLLDYSVDYGQGYLFGEPKPLRELALKSIDATDPIPLPLRAAG